MALWDDPEIDAFHRRYYHAAQSTGGTWMDTWWMGVKTLKCPLDLWIYQEILTETRPDLVIESGTAYGGSALFLATVMDGLGAGRVLTIDIEERTGRPSHSRIEYVSGSSTAPEVVERARTAASEARGVMVILDSDHARDHVLAELRAYAPLVTPSSYLVVEDTNVNGNPVFEEHGPGPMEALDIFLSEDRDFTPDASCEKLLLTFNPRGYLRRHAT